MVLPVVAVLGFCNEGRAQTPDVFFHAAPLSAARDPFAAPPPPPSLDHALEAQPRFSTVTPKIDFGNAQPLKDYPLIRDNSDDMFGRVPLNGGSFGIEAEQKLDLKKIAPNAYVDGNIEKNAKRPFVGLSIVAPYSSE